MSEPARERIRAGIVGRPHGLDGSFYVAEPQDRLLREGTLVMVLTAERKIVRRAGTSARPILRLEGIEDRDAIQALRGTELTVAAPSAPPLQDGEWWAYQLEGCSVYDGERRVGEVLALIGLPSCEALEVGAEHGVLLVPMVRDAVREVDVEERRIDIDMSFFGEQQ